MRKCSNVVMAIVLVSSSLLYVTHAADYYVAPDGSDAESGTLERPFQTIQRAADIMEKGDRCLIRGGTYRETVIPKNSGTASSPIVFMPYDNERVVIAGTELIENWSKQDGSIYKAKMNWTLGTGRNQVFVNGRMALEARTPNIDAHIRTRAATGKTDGYSQRNHLFELEGIEPMLFPARAGMRLRETGTRVLWDENNGVAVLEEFRRPNDAFKGGVYWGYHGAWRAQSALILGSDQAGLDVDEGWEGRFILGHRGGGVIMGLYEALDTGNEWYYDGENTLYLWAPDSGDVNGHVVEAKKRLYGFEIREKNHIHLKGLYFFGTSVFMPLSNDILIDGCHVKYATHYTYFNPRVEGDRNTPADQKGGIVIQGHRVVVRNSSIQYSAGSGIRMLKPDTTDKQSACEDVVIENNLVRYVNYFGTYAAGINTDMKNGLIQRNSIYQVGRSCINVGGGGGYRTGYNIGFHYNRLHEGMFIASDGGLVYAYGVSARLSDFSFNWLYNHHNKEGALLMLDQGGWDWYIHHNVFWIKDGKNFHTLGPTNKRNHIYNNTIIDLGWSGYVKVGRNNLNCFGNPDSVGIVDAAGFDFSLRANSLAIDQGDTVVSLQPDRYVARGDNMYTLFIRRTGGGAVSVSGLEAASGKAYEVVPAIQLGDPQFIDREHTWDTLGSYAGLTFIRTANDDREMVDEPFLRFSIDAAATVYVAYRPRRNYIPEWLKAAEWTKTGDRVSGDGTSDIYVRSFNAGQVVLGANAIPDTAYLNSRTGLPIDYTIPRDQWSGAAPDLGAYEYGMEKWVPGHTWGEPHWVYPVISTSSVLMPAALSARRPVLTATPQYLLVWGTEWSLSIYSLCGRVVRSVSAHHKQVVKTRIGLQGIARGTYMIHLTSPAGMQSTLLVKSR